MLDSYASIIDQIKEEVLSFDEDDDEYFTIGKDFMRFRFRTDDNLVWYTIKLLTFQFV